VDTGGKWGLFGNDPEKNSRFATNFLFISDNKADILEQNDKMPDNIASFVSDNIFTGFELVRHGEGFAKTDPVNMFKGSVLKVGKSYNYMLFYAAFPDVETTKRMTAYFCWNSVIAEAILHSEDMLSVYVVIKFVPGYKDVTEGEYR
jgi:hypothetical protein